MKVCKSHLSNTLKVSITHGFGTECANFYKYLMDQVFKVHANDRTEPQQHVISNSYNSYKVDIA